MIRDHWHTHKRSAFTLVELLVVILIIAILVSLLAAAVMKAMDKIPQVQTSTEITEMSLALRAFMLDYNLSDPPPSYLVLNEAAPLATPNATFLSQVFGKNLGVGQPFVDWNGDGILNGPWALQGEQCLVFYLGGIPTAPGLGGFAPQGFSTNNSNPAMSSALSPKRKGPYFPFVITRLKPPPLALAASAPTFPVYIDPWERKSGANYFAATTVPGVTLGGTPYAYFSSNGTNNSGYLLNTTPSPIPLDCQAIGALPYFITGTTPAQYMNSNTWQILSAGKDGAFGTTGWIPASGATGAGFDDQSNFSAGILGAGQS